MARDIEEFLKMAAKRRQQQKQGGGRPAPPPQQQAPAQQPPQQRQQLRQQPAQPQVRRPPVQPAADDEIIVLGSTTNPTIDPYRQSVEEHVRTHIDTSSLGEHASHLGEEVGLADDKLEARLHSTFDHSVSRLEGSSGSVRQVDSGEDLNAIATEIVEMLRTPKSIRQAIILNEVLTRPIFD